MTNCKRILRFYFKADDLNHILDDLILTSACRSAEIFSGEKYADKILSLISVKDELADLWQLLDRVMAGLKGSEREVLRGYALSRCGIRRLDCGRQREIRRAVVKFSRHARGIERCAAGVKLVGEYYCFL